MSRTFESEVNGSVKSDTLRAMWLMGFNPVSKSTTRHFVMDRLTVGIGKQMNFMQSHMNRLASCGRPLFVAARARTALLSVALVLICAVVGAARAATSANANSPLGINLTNVSISDPEIPLINIFHAGGGWMTHSGSSWDTGEEQYLNLDANGYPITLTAVHETGAQKFTSVGTLLARNLPNTANGAYPAGRYIVLYDGQGTMTYQFDAVKNATLSTPGRDVLDVTPTSGGGIHLIITSTDPNHTGNYIRNIRVVQASNEAAVNAGQVFNPAFLSLLQKFRVLRFMDWLQTNNSTLSSWANRPLLTSAFWGSSSGVPVEAAVQLANALSADAWLNVPHMADDNYITQMANLVHGQLGSTQRVYLEYSNETWNGVFSQASWVQAQGKAEWPTANVLPFQLNRDWYGQRVAQMCDIWKSAWGADAGRVTCVLGAQAASAYTAVESLNCPLWKAGAPCAGHGIGAVAIAPYFGGNVPSSWTSQSDGGLNSLFASLTSQNDPSIPSGGWLNESSGWEAAYGPALAPFKLPMVAYEGGQAFQSFPNGVNPDGSNTPLTNLYIAANRDARMGPAYTSYLQQWKSNGGQLFMIFADIGQPSQYGEWGLLESLMQVVNPTTMQLTTAAGGTSPKWQAVQNFMSNTACWWTGCTGTVSSGGTPTPKVPLPPTNVTVQ
jgi:hypothetical protein